ncbi:MAG: ankyrin repeat domain-containing protein [Candidatus Babeliaceae bacterium]|nr:ankyrin repeat domain-containing protein [Candidatus Babeliaceae bacterium]
MKINARFILSFLLCTTFWVPISAQKEVAVAVSSNRILKASGIAALFLIPAIYGLYKFYWWYTQPSEKYNAKNEHEGNNVESNKPSYPFFQLLKNRNFVDIQISENNNQIENNQRQIREENQDQNPLFKNENQRTLNSELLDLIKKEKWVQLTIKIQENLDQIDTLKLDDDGNTIIHIAALTQNLQALKAVIQGRANFYIRNNNNKYPTDLIKSPNLKNEVLQQLSKRLEMESREKQLKNIKSLLTAVKNQNFELAKKLLNKEETPVTITNSNGHTLLDILGETSYKKFNPGLGYIESREKMVLLLLSKMISLTDDEAKDFWGKCNISHYIYWERTVSKAWIETIKNKQEKNILPLMKDVAKKVASFCTRHTAPADRLDAVFACWFGNRTWPDSFANSVNSLINKNIQIANNKEIKPEEKLEDVQNYVVMHLA